MRTRLVCHVANAITASLLVGCLGDRALRRDCEADSDCAVGTLCSYGVCAAPPSGDAALDVDGAGGCGVGLWMCPTGCVDRLRDPENCGECGHECVAGPFETVTCEGGGCAVLCERGHFDVDPETPGCEYACVRTSPSVEVCDGVDNDCDGAIDEDDASLETPGCPLQRGVCEGATQACVRGELRVCAVEDYAGHAGALYEPEGERTCDGLDNDCSGAADELCCGPAQTPYQVVASGDTVVPLAAAVTTAGTATVVARIDAELVWFAVEALETAARTLGRVSIPDGCEPVAVAADPVRVVGYVACAGDDALLTRLEAGMPPASAGLARAGRVATALRVTSTVDGALLAVREDTAAGAAITIVRDRGADDLVAAELPATLDVVVDAAVAADGAEVGAVLATAEWVRLYRLNGDLEPAGDPITLGHPSGGSARVAACGDPARVAFADADGARVVEWNPLAGAVAPIFDTAWAGDGDAFALACVAAASDAEVALAAREGTTLLAASAGWSWAAEGVVGADDPAVAASVDRVLIAASVGRAGAEELRVYRFGLDSSPLCP
ncbi:MAG: hypothetical protein H6698_08155 [Myxococcales bacterium]|nr:hypothetical protein [Myxococcales bacterium]MCB9520637.1 hypothetical protein [Myxococcales bacterium]MCB9534261.1 hypothetical protein [Myxococcales bacterium]